MHAWPYVSCFPLQNSHELTIGIPSKAIISFFLFFLFLFFFSELSFGSFLLFSLRPHPACMAMCSSVVPTEGLPGYQLCWYPSPSHALFSGARQRVVILIACTWRAWLQLHLGLCQGSVSLACSALESSPALQHSLWNRGQYNVRKMAGIGIRGQSPADGGDSLSCAPS